MFLFVENDPGVPSGQLANGYAGLDEATVAELDKTLTGLSVKLIGVPHTSQETNYSCGAAALLGILRYWGVYEGREKPLYAALETTPEDGTSPAKLAEVAQMFGLDAEQRMGLSLNDLRDALRRLTTPILFIQAWAGMEVHRDSCEAGHFVVLVGMDEKNAYFMDPASHLTTHAYLPLAKLEEVWFGCDGLGKRYERHAVMIRGHEAPTGSDVSGPLETAVLMEAKAIGTAQMYGQVSMRDLVLRHQGAFASTLRSRIRQASTNAVRALGPIGQNAESEILALMFEWFEGRINYRKMQTESAKVWRRAYEQVREVGRRASAIERHGERVDARVLHEEEKWFRSAVREELTYWHTFLHEIESDQVSEERLLERLTSYVKALRFMYESSRVIALPDNVLLYWMGPRDERNCDGCVYLLERSPFTKNSIPAVPRDGSTPCLTNCRHKIVVRVAENPEDVRRREQTLPARSTMVAALTKIKHDKHGHHRHGYVARTAARAAPHARNPFHDAAPLPPRTAPFNTGEQGVPGFPPRR